jgi:hypothetical protein
VEERGLFLDALVFLVVAQEVKVLVDLVPAEISNAI